MFDASYNTKRKPFGGKMKVNAGKGSQHEMLPHRAALTQLTSGSPVQRSLNNYAKLTPSGITPAPAIEDVP